MCTATKPKFLQNLLMQQSEKEKKDFEIPNFTDGDYDLENAQVVNEDEEEKKKSTDEDGDPEFELKMHSKKIKKMEEPVGFNADARKEKGTVSLGPMPKGGFGARKRKPLSLD